MDEYLISKKNKRISSDRNNSFFGKFAIKFLVLVIITLGLLIALKSNTKFKMQFYEHVYNKHLSFASINKLYQDTFGSPIPFKDFFEKNNYPVFNEKINYKTLNKYYDGIALGVNKEFVVPVIETGMVIFVGEKENYGNTIIIEQIDGVEVWYGNLANINLKMYDYVEKGTIVGNVNDSKLYLVFKKDGKIVGYENYLKN